MSSAQKFLRQKIFNAAREARATMGGYHTSYVFDQEDALWGIVPARDVLQQQLFLSSHYPKKPCKKYKYNILINICSLLSPTAISSLG